MFKKILKMQKDGDFITKRIRKITYKDIMFSIIAESIELNEENEDKYSYKTWKRVNPYCKIRESKELADVMIFILQMINHTTENCKNENEENIIYGYETDFEVAFKKAEVLKHQIRYIDSLMSLINDCTTMNTFGIICSFALVCNHLGYTKEQVYEFARNKMEYNKTRTDRVLNNK
ncbi:MAG: dUTP diphosphatase [Fusobacteriaceae bacterium]